jgi:hypothetical protein
MKRHTNPTREIKYIAPVATASPAVYKVQYISITVQD